MVAEILEANDLALRKWAITEHILEVAVKRRVSPSLVRAEIISLGIGRGLLSMLEKERQDEDTVSLSVNADYKLAAYFTKHLKREICLDGKLWLRFD